MHLTNYFIHILIDIHHEPYGNRKFGNDQRYINGIRGKTVITQGKECICEIDVKYVIPRNYGEETERNSDIEDYVD